MNERNDKKISIIIPTHNSGNELLSVIADIFGQTYNNYEIIIIDDGSVDNTKQLLKEYESKIKYIYQENKGVSSARNAGIRNANGDYICFVDADDGLDKNYLKNMIDIAIENCADLVVGGYKFIRFDDKKIIDSRNAKKWDIIFDKSHNIFQYSSGAKLYKRSLLIDNQIFFSDGEQIEDGPFSIITNMIADKSIAINSMDYLYYDRERMDSQIHIVKNKNKKIVLPKKAIIEIIEIFNKSKYVDDKREMFEYCILKELSGLLTNVGKNFNKETRRELCDYCYSVLSKYFPNINKNKYVRINVLKGLPISHRIAVKLTLLAYKLHVLYIFSLLTSIMLRIVAFF